VTVRARLATLRALPLAALMAAFILPTARVHADSSSGAVAGPAAYSAAGLYNLANSYARDGKPGMAVLNYQRARLLAAYDPDVESNLRFVRDSVRLPPESPNRFERLARIASPEAIAWAGLAGLITVGAALLAGQLNRRHVWLRRLFLVGGIALTGLTIANAVVLWPTLHSAVVIANASPARVSPVPMGDPLFVLAEAETVRLTAEHEGFVLVRTQRGQMGWVARANLAPILPNR
jgi:hypothetical protein